MQHRYAAIQSLFASLDAQWAATQDSHAAARERAVVLLGVQEACLKQLDAAGVPRNLTTAAFQGNHLDVYAERNRCFVLTWADGPNGFEVFAKPVAA